MGLPGPSPTWTGDRVHVRTDEAVAIIGDIHGRADLLLPLLERLHGRAILVLGDVCDRGPDTRECIQALVDCGASGVLGNHDVWFGQWSAGEGFSEYALSVRMGGAATLASYGAEPLDASWGAVPREHSAFINGLHLAIDLMVDDQRYWLVHAGIPAEAAQLELPLNQVVPYLARRHPNVLIWRKTDPDRMPVVDRPVIMGHWPVAEPSDDGRVIAVDTGAGAGSDRLTALLLPERTFVTVEGGARD